MHRLPPTTAHKVAGGEGGLAEPPVTWDEIIEQCIQLSSQFDLIGMTPKEVILEILRLEHERPPFQEVDVLDTRPELHAAAVLFYGSWDHVLTIVGLKKYECSEL